MVVMNVYHDCPNEKSEEMSVSLRSINVGFWRIFISCSGDKWLGNGLQKPLRRFNVRPKVQVDRNSQRSFLDKIHGWELVWHVISHITCHMGLSENVGYIPNEIAI